MALAWGELKTWQDLGGYRCDEPDKCCHGGVFTVLGALEYNLEWCQEACCGSYNDCPCPELLAEGEDDDARDGS